MEKGSRIGKVKTAVLNYPATLENEYGGIYFYGAHLAEMTMMAFGYDAVSVIASEKNGIVTAIVKYDRYQITLNFIPGSNEYYAVLYGENGTIMREIDINAKYCVTASSGTAAIHIGLGTVGVTAGDEVITSPITDMGSVIGILYQNAIPVFADLDPNTYNLDPKSVESKITDKTKAILVVHLAGNPADMDSIMDVARRHHCPGRMEICGVSTS